MKLHLWAVTSALIALNAASDCRAAQAVDNAKAATPAADEANDGLADIVVTAQRRSENLQKVPLAISVATAEELQAGGLTGVQDLKMAVPGIEVQAVNGYAIPILRGIGSKVANPGLEPPVATYVDGVYYASTTGTLLAFNNISQIEVLKGPQGTLFGRNATGGLIQIITRDPGQELTGKFSVGYGNYQTLRGDAYIGGGLSENLAADIAFVGTTMGQGYGTNFVTGEDVYRVHHDFGLRSKWVLDVGEDTTLRMILDYQANRHSMNAIRIFPGTTVPVPFGPTYGGDEYDIDTDQQPLAQVKQGGVSLKIDHDFGSVRFASITAYREAKERARFDFDFTRTRGIYVDSRQNDKQFSQEVQLLSDTDSRFNWVLGAYYFNASSRYVPTDVFFAGVASALRNPPITKSRVASGQLSDSIAGFGQGTLELFEGLRGTIGLRYTSEERSLDNASQVVTLTSGAEVTVIPVTNQSKRFNKLTWRFALDYQLAPTVLAYAYYNRGFKSGGFNPNTLTLPPFRPEVLDAYEIGLKTDLLDRTLRFNMAGFYYDYSDLQVQRVVPQGTGIQNGAKARVYGVDGEIEAQLSRTFNLRAGFQYLDSRFKSFPSSLGAVPRPAGGFTVIPSIDASGNRLLFSPKWTTSATATYVVPVSIGEVRFSGSYYYNDGYFVEPDNSMRQPAYSQVNLSAAYEATAGYRLMLWVNNATNEKYGTYDGLASFGPVGVRRISYAAPRTYGITLGYSF